MRFRRRRCLGLALLVSSLAGAETALAQTPPQAATRTEPAVTPVTGASWLTKLGVTLSQTSIGAYMYLAANPPRR